MGVAFQSASHTGEPWLGPDLLEAVERSGARDVLVCPIGFVADHLGDRRLSRSCHTDRPS